MGYRDGQDVVHCLDAATGDKRWEYGYACELVNTLHEGGPGATPTVVGGRVYTLSREGQLHCLDADSGKVLWLRRFKSEIGAEQPEWGFTSSPYLSGNNILVDVGFVTAVDQTSGEIRWKSPQHRAGYGTPAELELAGRRLIAVFSNDGLSIYDPGSGEETAFHPYESRYLTTSTTPVVHGDTIFISVGYGGGCTLLRLAEGQLQVVYTNKEMSNHFNNCVLYQGHLFGFDGDSHASSQVRLVCMEHATGKVKWHERGFGCGSLMIADGKLILLTDTGTLVAAVATPTKFQELGRVQVLDGKCWTMPVLAGGRIYCRTAAGELACVDVRG
jgi:outer membrane protein assembly factor BamB